MSITSNAKWTKIPCSSDSHGTTEQAEMICKILKREYGPKTPCEIRGVCLESWVEIDGVNQEHKEIEEL